MSRTPTGKGGEFHPWEALPGLVPSTCSSLSTSHCPFLSQANLTYHGVGNNCPQNGAFTPVLVLLALPAITFESLHTQGHLDPQRRAHSTALQMGFLLGSMAQTALHRPEGEEVETVREKAK